MATIVKGIGIDRQAARDITRFVASGWWEFAVDSPGGLRPLKKGGEAPAEPQTPVVSEVPVRREPHPTAL